MFHVKQLTTVRTKALLPFISNQQLAAEESHT